MEFRDWSRLVAGVFAGCFLQASHAHATACVPGAQIECACPGGGGGVQTCASDGTRYEPCACDVPVAVAPAPPPLADDIEPDTVRSNTGLMIAGIVLLGSGFVGATVGVGIAAAAIDANPVNCYQYNPTTSTTTSYQCGTSDDDDVMASAGVVIGISASVMVAGAIMTPLGARQVARVEASLGFGTFDVRVSF